MQSDMTEMFYTSQSEGTGVLHFEMFNTRHSCAFRFAVHKFRMFSPAFL